MNENITRRVKQCVQCRKAYIVDEEGNTTTCDYCLAKENKEIQEILDAERN